MKKRLLDKMTGGAVVLDTASNPIQTHDGPTGRRALQNDGSTAWETDEPGEPYLSSPRELTIDFGSEGNLIKKCKSGPPSLLFFPFSLHASMVMILALDCWFLTGPTAAGKTSVGVELARRIGAEIISMDSMALYRGMNIGTAKPTPEQCREIPHHLIDAIDPHEEYSLARYIEDARQCAVEIRARRREVLFVGGTPLYLKGLLRGIFKGPPADLEFRERLGEQAQRQGSESLHRRLAEVDPVAAERLHPNDTRRLIRALEVFEKTGRPISELQQQFDTGRRADECRVFVLDWPRHELHERINRRVEAMFAAGLVEEVRGLLAQNRPLSKTAAQAVGYREVIEHIEGKRDLAATIELVKTHTRRFAKRQDTWFRSLSECRSIEVVASLDVVNLAAGIASWGRS